MAHLISILQMKAQNVCPHRMLKLSWRTFRDYFSMINNSNAPGKMIGFIQILCSKQNGGSLCHQSTNNVPNLISAAGIQAGSGFIKEE